MLGHITKTTYLNIVGDKIMKKTSSADPQGVERKNKNGNIVFEIPYDFVEGKIESITVKDGDYGKQWLLEMYDGNEHFTLQLSYSGGYTKSFLSALPNIDLTKSVRLTPYQKEVNGKNRYTLYVNQGERESVRWAYTKDEPNGLPEMEQIMVKGSLTWDDTKQLEFLEKMVNEKFASPEQETEQEQEQKQEQVAPRNIMDVAQAATTPIKDDLPF